MTPGAFALLRALADGRSHSGARHAAECGITRSAVWKRVRRLRQAGLPVEGRPGGGYRLAWPVDLLDADRVRAAADRPGAGIEVHEQLDSTNSELGRRFDHRCAVLAEYQRAGRGRRGRGWISPPASGVWLSYGYRFDCGLQRLSALSLAIGVAIAEALPLAALVKWPNDVVVDGRKLGGVLIELRGAAEGPCEAVVGVGINVRLPGLPEASPDQPWTDLFRESNETPDRSRLAGELVAALDEACARFAVHGFDAFVDRWRALDALAGREVRVERPGQALLRGRADGVNRRGELRVLAGDGVCEIDSGAVSVRAA